MHPMICMHAEHSEILYEEGSSDHMIAEHLVISKINLCNGIKCVYLVSFSA